MVIGHADCPGLLESFLYEFHMPVFFITAGYFFSLRYLDDEATFVKKRIKGLYLPFLKWSVFFLVIHNWMFDIGILNEKYGNWTGGVTHPYTWHQIQQNLWNMVTAMGGYDQFLNGAFWFFRGLLVASILYLVLYKTVDYLLGKTGKTYHRLTVPFCICIIMLLISGWKTYEGLKVINIVQGGYREMMGTFFFGCGFIFRQIQKYYTPRWWQTILFAAVVYFFSRHLTANMNWRSSFVQFLSLPLPALCGFLMTYNVSTWLDRHDGWLKRFLVYCGENTMPVFVFHILSYKVVSLLKIWYYQMDPQQIGCHMVIHEHAHDDCFWILYAIAGVLLPLSVQYLVQKVRNRIKSHIR